MAAVGSRFFGLARRPPIRDATRRQYPLRINGARMMDAIHSTCEIGAAHRYGEHPTETGMARLALNDDDKKVRLWLIEQLEAVGCKITIDQMGNIFGVRPGKSKDALPVMMGSHLDTQPTGGRYDGILGVHAGLEALRTIHENGYETEGPVGVINWTNEEGARFPIVTVSSGVWAGSIPLETGWDCVEVTAPQHESKQPQTLKQELVRTGFLGDVPASYESTPIAAHFELHIEQGPILEDEGLKVGIVKGAQAYNWYEIEVKGRDSHAGTTPFNARKDSILAASRMIAASNLVAKEYKGLITTGIFQVEPGSINTMAHTVKFTIDARHPDTIKLAEMVAKCREVFDDIAQSESEKGVEARWTTLTENEAVNLHPDCIKAIEESVQDLAVSQSEGVNSDRVWNYMLSGAGHDSCHVSKRCPTAMIFAPTRDGMSHTPTEYCPPEDCIFTANVLLNSVLKYDLFRKKQGDLN